MLLYPERGLALNATAADILALCTGELHGRRDRRPPGRASTAAARARPSTRRAHLPERLAERGLSGATR